MKAGITNSLSARCAGVCPFRRTCLRAWGAVHWGERRKKVPSLQKERENVANTRSIVKKSTCFCWRFRDDEKDATFSSRKPLFFEMNDLPLRLIKHNFPFSSAALRRPYSVFRRAYSLWISANDLWLTVRWTIPYRCLPSGEGDTVGFAKVAILFSKKWHEVSISCCVCFLWSKFSAFTNCGCLQQKVPERIKKMHSGLLIIGLSSVFSPWAVQFALRLEPARFSAYRKRQTVFAL